MRPFPQLQFETVLLYLPDVSNLIIRMTPHINMNSRTQSTDSITEIFILYDIYKIEKLSYYKEGVYI